MSQHHANKIRGDAAGASTTSPSRSTPAPALAAIAIVVVPLMQGASGGEYADADRMLWTTLLGWAAAVSLLAGVRRGDRPDAAGSGALLYLAGSLIACVFALVPSTALFGDVERRAGVLSDVALVAIFFAARRLGRRSGQTRAAVTGVVVGGAVLCLVAIAQALGLPPFADAPVSRPGSLLGGPTYLGAYTAALIPLGIAVCRGRIRSAITTLFVVSLILTGSRVSALAALIGAAITIGGAAGPVSGRSRRNLLIGGGAAAVVVGALSIPAVARNLPDGLLPARITSLFTSEDARDRILLYRDAVSASREPSSALLTGHGPDSVGTLFAASLSSETAKRFGGRTHIDRLHSDVLDLVFTRGALALFGILLMVGAAVRRGVRPSTGAGAEDLNPSVVRAGIAGAVLATFIDGILSVPGATSHLWLFFGAGIASADPALRDEENPAAYRDHARKAASRADAPTIGWSGGLAAAGCVATVYALPLEMAWIAAAWLFLIPRGGRARALRGAGVVAVCYVIVAGFIRFGISSVSAQAAEGLAERSRINLVITAIAVAACVCLIVRTGRLWPSGRNRRVALGLLAILFLPVGIDTFQRLLAAVEARAATNSQIAGAPPRAAEELLSSAAARTPESPRYAALALLALSDRARQIVEDQEEVDRAIVRAGLLIGAILSTEPVEARSLTLAARAVLRLSSLSPQQEVGLQFHAVTLANRAVAAAPYSTPALATAADAALRRGEATTARGFVARGQAADGEDPFLQLLRARVEAYDRDLSAAAHHYGLSLPHLVTASTVLEARLGIALAAAARSSTEDSAALIVSAAELVRLASPLDISPVRPLLHFFNHDVRTAVFDRARALRRDLAHDIDAIETALYP